MNAPLHGAFISPSYSPIGTSRYGSGASATGKFSFTLSFGEGQPRGQSFGFELQRGNSAAQPREAIDPRPAWKSYDR
jgi:hypothetical protein